MTARDFRTPEDREAAERFLDERDWPLLEGEPAPLPEGCPLDPYAIRRYVICSTFKKSPLQAWILRC